MRGMAVRSVVALFCLLDCSRTVWADSLTPAMRAEDSRLDRIVNLSATHIYLGELLPLLTKQTGVALYADEVDGATDEQVFIHVRKVPLGDLMDAIWSLMSYRQAEWHWERTGAAGAYRYVLMRPTGAQRLGARLRDWIQAAFEAQATALIAAVDASPDDRRKRLLAAYHGDEKTVDAALRSDWTWAGRKLFKESLSPDEQLQVLRGSKKTRIAVDKLSPSGKEYVSLYRSMNYVSIEGGGAQPPKPDTAYVEFNVQRANGVPVLCIYVSGSGSNGYAGGAPLEREFDAFVDGLWSLSGDQKTDPADQSRIAQTIGTPLPVARDIIWRGSRNMVRPIKELAEGADISLIARLPRDQSRALGHPAGSTVQSYLNTFHLRMTPLTSKWRSHVLLITNRLWHVEEAGNVPYRIEKQLRAAEARGRGFIPLPDIARASILLSDEQLGALEEDRPIMGNVRDLRPLFEICASSAEACAALQSSNGLWLRGEVRHKLASSSSAEFDSFVSDEVVKSIRLIERQSTKNMTAGGVMVKMYLILFVGTEGKVVHELGFAYVPSPAFVSEPNSHAN